MDAKSQIEKIVEQIKDSLNLGPKNIIGVDIGQSAVKIAEVEVKDDSYTLVNYSSLTLPEAAIIEDEINKEEEVIEVIKAAFDEVNFTKGVCCLGISGPNTVARKLQLAGGDEEEIEDQVVWEAEQYLPFAIEECNFDHFVIGENEGGGVDVIVAAARKDIITAYKSVVERAGQKVKIMDLSQLALTNVFNKVQEAREEEIEGSWILLDLGAQKTAFMIYKNGVPIFIKEINVGGGMITEEIQRQLGVNYKEAEDLKITGDDNGNLPEEILEIMDDVVESIFSEIKKTIDFYISSTSDENFAGCSITGGSALIPGILEGIQALLGIEVEVFNPFSVVNYNEKNISEEDMNEIAFKGSTVIGLAMRQL